MRLLLTTIILTMLAQPVWANYFDCDRLFSEIERQLNIMTNVDEMLRNGEVAVSDAIQISEQARRTAVEFSIIYNAICKQ